MWLTSRLGSGTVSLYTYTADLSGIHILKEVSVHQYPDDTQAIAYGPVNTSALLVIRVHDANMALDL